jgi:serine/threonine-protein phosphatase 2A activator
LIRESAQRGQSKELSKEFFDALSHFLLAARMAEKPIEFIRSDDPCELSSLTKNVKSESDMECWMSSPAYQIIFNVLHHLSQSVKSLPRSSPHPVRPIIAHILDSFKILHSYLEEVEPLTTHQRYGNRAFRTWLSKVYDNRAQILCQVTDNPEPHEYYVQSFGSWSRIDFGTGHEMNFLAFIASLAVLNLITPEDGPALVFDVFWQYWDLHIAIQKRYQLEPAGSHGAWGADDYVCLPFVFGASQLIDHTEITPENVIDPVVAKAHAAEYSYCKWIDIIHGSKHGRFAEHSRTLYSLRKLPHFEKLADGMLKMYQGEVMDRFLVVQHLRFGTLLKWE